MARVELQHGKDDEARKMAQKTIDQQSAEVEEMTKWVEATCGFLMPDVIGIEGTG